MTSPAATRNLYSLNEFPIEVELGQLGPMTVLPRPVGAPYGVTVVEPRVTLKDKGEDDFERHTTSATTIVEDIIYRYPGNGLFLAADDASPSTAEIAQAEKEFELADASRIATAHKLWDKDHDRGQITIQARQAARRRNQVVDWATNVAVEMKECPECGENIRASAKKCRYCQSTLGQAAVSVPVAETVPSDGESEFARETAAALARAGKKR